MWFHKSIKYTSTTCIADFTAFIALPFLFSRVDACVSSAERALSYLKGAGYGHVTRQSSLSSDAPDEDEVIRPRLRVLSRWEPHFSGAYTYIV